MRIAVISALFPPNVLGGAEIATQQLVQRLASRGHEIDVLTTGKENSNRTENGYRVETVAMPRGYPLLEFSRQKVIDRAIWHLQDHADPRNKLIWGRFLDIATPDVALVPIVQGLGYNGLEELARRDIPTIAVLHDLSYVCYKMTMFEKGRTCKVPCRVCGVSSGLKARYLTRIPRLGFVSPSAANLQRVQSFVPIADRPAQVILNPMHYPEAIDVARVPLRPRLLYVGQISAAKGTSFLLETVSNLDPTLDLEVVVVGDGTELEVLKRRFGSLARVTFTGKVSLQEVANQMSRSTVLCVPSLWPDNSPGVIVHALQLGLPVLGSDVGGIGELVKSNHNGILLPPGDISAWSLAITDVVMHRVDLEAWRQTAKADAVGFAPDRQVDAYEAFLHQIVSLRPTFRRLDAVPT